MELLQDYSPAVWFLLFLTYSCAGWVMEIIITIFLKHRIINRGFFIGPICPIYGVAALIATITIGHVENLAAIFCVSVVGAAILEYSTSFFMEKLFRVRWWDYSDQTFNVNGRICISVLLRFGIAGILIIRVFNPLLFAAFTSISPAILNTVALILAVIFAVDVIVSLILIFGFRVTVDTVERDATEEISERVRAIIMKKGHFSRRIAKAFPNYQPKKTTRRHKTTTSRRKTASKSTKPQR